MLRGHQSSTVDAKGRLKVPALFLGELHKDNDEFYITSTKGDYARLYPMKVWQAIEESLMKLPSQHPTRRKFQVVTSYYGSTAKADAQGRVLLPAILRESAGLTGEVTVLGNQNYLEIWNSGRLVDQQIHGNAWNSGDDETLGNLGI